jgi:hypothetical protein
MQNAEGQKCQIVIRFSIYLFYYPQFNAENSSVLLSCIEWDVKLVNNSTPSDSSSSSHVIFERMFVRLFPNGCRPRFACVQFRRPSPNVLLLRVSRFRSWPFVAEAGSPVQCSTHFIYDDDNGERAVSNYRLYLSVHSPTTTTTAAAEAPPVDDYGRRCDKSLVTLKLNEAVGFGDFQADFSGGIRCRGRLQTNGDDDGDLAQNAADAYSNGPAAAFRLILLDCPTIGHESEQSYRCVDLIARDFQLRRVGSFDSSTSEAAASAPTLAGDLRLLTETGEDGDVLCWWFPRSTRIRTPSGLIADQFHLLPGAACYDDDVKDRLMSSVNSGNDTQRRLGVLATFTPLVPPPDVAPEPIQELPVKIEHVLSSLREHEEEDDDDYSQIGTREIIQYSSGNAPFNIMWTHVLVSLFVACLFLV